MFLTFHILFIALKENTFIPEHAGNPVLASIHSNPSPVTVKQIVSVFLFTLHKSHLCVCPLTGVHRDRGPATVNNLSLPHRLEDYTQTFQIL